MNSNNKPVLLSVVTTNKELLAKLQSIIDEHYESNPTDILELCVDVDCYSEGDRYEH